MTGSLPLSFSGVGRAFPYILSRLNARADGIFTDLAWMVADSTHEEVYPSYRRAKASSQAEKSIIFPCAYLIPMLNGSIGRVRGVSTSGDIWNYKWVYQFLMGGGSHTQNYPITLS